MAKFYPMRGGFHQVNKYFKEFITNKTALMAIFIITVLNILGYLMYGNMNAVVCFFLIGGITYLFNKNMVLVLGIPLLLVNLLILSHRKYGPGYGIEGMESGGDDTSTPAPAPVPANKKMSTKQKKQNTQKTKKENMMDTPFDSDSEVQYDGGTDMAPPSDSMENTLPSEETFEGITKNKKFKVDYASTIEDAYDELNNVIGGDGIKRLTSDTQNLMKQQLQ